MTRYRSDLGTPETVSAPTPTTGRRASPMGCLTLLLVLSFIVLVALAMAVRTQGACGLMADYLHDRLGLDVRIGGARIGLPYDLVLENVQTKTNEAGAGALTCREARVGIGFDGSLQVGIRGADLRLVRGARNEWQPEPFDRLGPLRDVRSVAALFDELPRRLALDVRDSAIRWVDPTTAKTTSVEGLSLRVTPIALSDRTLRFYELGARHVVRASGSDGRSIRRVWLSARENPYLEVQYRAIWDGEGAADADFWSRPAPGRAETGDGP